MNIHWNLCIVSVLNEYSGNRFVPSSNKKMKTQQQQQQQFNFLGLIIDSNLNWKAHLSAIGTKISRVIGLLHILKYIFPKQVLHSIYDYDYDYEMLLLRHKEIQYNMS